MPRFFGKTTDGHGSRFAQTVLRNASQVKRLRQDRLALNLDFDRDRDPDRKINDLGKGKKAE